MNDDRRRGDSRGMLTGGLIVLGIGVLFLLRNLGIIPDIGDMWPVILIIIGVALVVGSFKGMGSQSGQA